MSEVLTDTENIQNICSFIVDTLDGQQTIKFIIEVNDDPDANDTVDHYSTFSGHWYYHTVNTPYSNYGPTTGAMTTAVKSIVNSRIQFQLYPESRRRQTSSFSNFSNEKD